MTPLKESRVKKGMSTADIAWLSGLFEGEGCISLRRKDRTQAHEHRLEITSTDRDVLERVLYITGAGSIQSNGARQEGWKQSWTFSVCRRNEVIDLLFVMLPFLCQRRKQKAMETLDLLNVSGHEFFDEVVR